MERERAMVDAAAAREDQEDEKTAHLHAAKQVDFAPPPPSIPFGDHGPHLNPRSRPLDIKGSLSQTEDKFLRGRYVTSRYDEDLATAARYNEYRRGVSTSYLCWTRHSVCASVWKLRWHQTGSGKFLYSGSKFRCRRLSICWTHRIL